VPVTKNSSLGQAMGLLTDSVVVTDNLATVLEREFDKAIGCCNGMPAVDQALRTTLNL
jgi:mRNA interferase MazF